MDADSLLGIEIDELDESTIVSREYCKVCKRPITVCYCACLPKMKLTTPIHILILQHPSEEERKIRTGHFLNLSLSTDCITIVRNRRFNKQRTPDVIRLLEEDDGTYLVYPRKDSIHLTSDQLTTLARPKCLVFLDGTWDQTKSMYAAHTVMHKMRKICFPPNPITGELEPSRYIIRKQPYKGALSTAEAVARMLDLWDPRDNNSHYQDILLKPLDFICETQRKWIYDVRPQSNME